MTTTPTSLVVIPPVVAARMRALPRRPRVWPSYVNFVILVCTVLGGEMLAGLCIAVYLAAQRVPQDEFAARVTAMVTQPLPFVCIVLLVGFVQDAAALLPAVLSPTPWRERLNIRKPRLPWALLVLAAIGAICYSFAFEGLTTLLQLNSQAMRQMALAIHDSSGVLAVLMLLGIGVLGPAAEELFFRGYLQTRLVARHGPFWGILITSLFFAIMHFDPLHSTFALGFGIYCGIIAYRAGSIWASFLAHAANNTLSVVETWYLVEPESIGAWVLITAVAAFFAVALILPVMLVKPSEREGERGGAVRATS